MAAVDNLFEQALQLPENERGQLVSRLLRSLEPDHDDDLAPDTWEAAWTDVLDQRMTEIREQAVELIDGERVFDEAAGRIASRRP